MVHVPLMFLYQNGVNFLMRLALQGGKNLDNSRLEMARVA